MTLTDRPAADVVVRPLRWWDVPAAAALERRLFPHDPWTAGMFWSELAGVPDTRLLLAAEHEGALVGYASLLVVAGEGQVATLAVAPELQRRGLGRALLRALLAEADRRGVGDVLLEVAADNGPGQALYASEGFAQVGVRRDYYAPGVDALVLRRRGPRSGPGEAR